MSVPAVEQPKEVAAAVAAVTEAERHIAAAQQRQREAAIGLDRARELDRADLAARIAAGAENPEPSREHRAEAEEQMQAAKEVFEAASTNLADAHEQLERMASEHADEWAERIRTAREKLDRDYLRALDKLAALEERRSELRGAAFWVVQRGRTAGGRAKLVPMHGVLPLKHPQHADALVPAELAISLMREYVAGSTVEAEAEAERQQAEQERAAEERRAQIAAAGGGVPAQ